MARQTKADIAARDEARAKLLEWLQVGDTVGVIQRNVSRSGMSRDLSLVITLDGAPFDITWLAARAMEDKLQERAGHHVIRVGGCGMNMHFAIVYNLARALWPEGHPCTGRDDHNGRKYPRCPSNDHSNERGADRAAGFRRGRIHSDGGYALHHRTL